jgi:TBC1 domain family protein 5
VLEADHSTALQLMLKYPTPLPPHGPHTFVDDALYLKSHLDSAGGVTLIFKYTGKSPANATLTSPTPTPRTTTPSFPKFNGLRPRTLSARSPLSTSARILQQPGGVEALLQGAAKSMLEKGEKLGINQAVRDVVGEFKRNMQESRSSSRSSRSLFGETPPPLPNHALAIASMERRNLQLAKMLEDSVTNLKQLVASGLDGDKAKHLEAIEIAAAKVQFVKACLEDFTLAPPDNEVPSLATLSISSPIEANAPTVALDTTPVVTSSSAVEDARTALSSPSPSVSSGKGSNAIASPPQPSSQQKPPADEADKMDTDLQENDTLPPLQSELPASPPLPPVMTEVLPDTPPRPAAALAEQQQQKQPLPQRPQGPIPARSTLAQSSFAWMLEPDTTTSSPLSPRQNASPLASSSPRRPVAAHKKRVNPSRERNAFLFGEVTADGAADGGGPLSADQVFGLQPMKKV